MPIDPQAFLRMAQIFQPQGPQVPQIPQLPTPGLGSLPIGNMFQPQQQEDDPNTFASRRFAEIYQPQQQSMNRLNELFGQYPQPQKPNMLTRIGASLASLNDPQVGMGMLYGPHLQNIANWKSQIDPALKAAEQEGSYNVNLRNLANQQVQQELNERKIAETERKNRESGETAQFRAETDRKRQEILAWSRQNPDLNIQSRGNVIVGIHPKTGAVVPIRDSAGRMMPGDATFARELQELRGQQRLDQIAAQGAETGINIAARGEIEKVLAGIRSGETLTVTSPDGTSRTFRYNPVEGTQTDIETGGIPPTRPPTTRFQEGGRTMLLPTQQRVDLVNRLQELKLRNPVLGALVRESRGFLAFDRRTTPEQEKEILNALYPGGNIPPQPRLVAPGLQPPSQTQPKPAPQPTPQTGGTGATDRVVVVGPDGKRFSLPRAQLKDFLASPQGKGFKEGR
jgi:hypothetical protein